MHAGCCARQIGSGEGRRGRIRRSYTVGILARRAAAMALATSDVDVVPDGSGKPGYCVCSHVERCGSAVVLSRSWESVVVGIHANSEEWLCATPWVGLAGLGEAACIWQVTHAPGISASVPPFGNGVPGPTGCLTDDRRLVPMVLWQTALLQFVAGTVLP